VKVGLKGIIGVVENSDHTGDIGAIGFSGYSEYLFSKDIVPIPVEIFGGITYAPEILSLRDCKNSFEFNIGSGIRIGRYASIRFSYTALRIEMESGDSTWNSTDNMVRIGLVMRF
jgi:hypothetical protein